MTNGSQFVIFGDELPFVNILGLHVLNVSSYILDGILAEADWSFTTVDWSFTTCWGLEKDVTNSKKRCEA